MSQVWAIADLHLSISCPEKDMAIFGPLWKDYQKQIEFHWKACVKPEDWVLIPGDITWAMKFEQALIDLAWIEALPGKKVISRGNHDYWWPSVAKWKSAGFQTIFNAQQQLVELDEKTAVVGCRFADSPEYSFDTIIDWNPTRPRADFHVNVETFEKELERLKQALALFKPEHLKRVVMIHYPPIGLFKESSKVSALLETCGVEVCVFGHLHSLKPQSASFGHFGCVDYVFCACDYIGFKPINLFSLAQEEKR